MSDNNASMMPELTLTPNDSAAEAAPQLVLGNEAPAAPAQEEKKIEPVKLDDSMLTDAE